MPYAPATMIPDRPHVDEYPPPSPRTVPFVDRTHRLSGEAWEDAVKQTVRHALDPRAPRPDDAPLRGFARLAARAADLRGR
jgi:hypothetical protein